MNREEEVGFMSNPHAIGLWICGRVLRTGPRPTGRVDKPGTTRSRRVAPNLPTLASLSPTTPQAPPPIFDSHHDEGLWVVDKAVTHTKRNRGIFMTFYSEDTSGFSKSLYSGGETFGKELAVTSIKTIISWLMESYGHVSFCVSHCMRSIASWGATDHIPVTEQSLTTQNALMKWIERSRK